MALQVVGRQQLAAFIQPDEVLTSGKLIERASDSGIARDCVRQWMHRTSPNDVALWRSTRLVLPGNERLFARRTSVGTEPFLNRVVSLLHEERPGIARAIRRLLTTGVMLRAEAEKVLASPIRGESAARFCNYRADVSALAEIKAGVTDGDGTALERIVRPHLAGEPASHALALRNHGELILQGQITRILLDHFRKQGLIAWTGYTLPDASDKWTDFNGFAFSAYGHSWLTPLLRWQKDNGGPNPTPVAIDVYVRACDETDVAGFVQRLRRACGNPRSRLDILGILAAPDFTQPAWKLSKDRGFLSVNLSQLFGKAAIEAIDRVRELLSYVSGDPARADANDMETLAETLNDLKNNPYVSDLRSVALEMWAALLLKAEGWEDVQTNLTVPFGSTNREIDVSGTKDARSQAYLVECKAEGGKKELDPVYVTKFYVETVPAFLKERFPIRPEVCKAEIWTTGIIGSAATERLKTMKLKPFVKPKLVSGVDLEQMTPRALNTGRRLLKAIAAS